MPLFEPEQLDVILGLQLSVAWAGERAEDPQRLNWWNTDLTDEAAGGDLFSRLLPKTAAWAGLELARVAAIRADHAARSKLAAPDEARSLYHFGFELDEAIQDRLEHHKRHGGTPAEVLATTWAVKGAWDKKEFAAFLKELGSSKVEETPGGRRLKALSDQPAEAAQALAAALLPLEKNYPLPHGAMPASS